MSAVHHRALRLRGDASVNDIPPEVRELVRRHVTSMDHVEVLMRLFESDGKPIAGFELQRTTHLSAKVMEQALADLMAASLVVTGDAEATYRYAPATRDAAEATVALAKLYHQRPVTLVKLVYTQPPNPVVLFSDAFRMRDRPEDE